MPLGLQRTRTLSRPGTGWTQKRQESVTVLLPRAGACPFGSISHIPLHLFTNSVSPPPSPSYPPEEVTVNQNTGQSAALITCSRGSFRPAPRPRPTTLSREPSVRDASVLSDSIRQDSPTISASTDMTMELLESWGHGAGTKDPCPACPLQPHLVGQPNRGPLSVESQVHDTSEAPAICLHRAPLLGRPTSHNRPAADLRLYSCTSRPAVSPWFSSLARPGAPHIPCASWGFFPQTTLAPSTVLSATRAASRPVCSDNNRRWTDVFPCMHTA